MKRKKDDSMNLDMEQVYHTYERMVYQFLYMRTRDHGICDMEKLLCGGSDAGDLSPGGHLHLPL